MIQKVKGTRDILPPESRLWNEVERTAHRILGGFGYSEIRLPLLEPTELFVRTVGEGTDIVSVPAELTAPASSGSDAGKVISSGEE